MDRGAGRAIVHRVTKESDVTEHPHAHTPIHIYVCTYVWCVYTRVHIFPRLCQSHSRVGEARRGTHGAGLLLSSSLRSSSYSILPHHSI